MKKLLREWWPILIYLLAYFLAINLVTLNRFWQFEVYYFDHGIFDQALWNIAHFKAPLVDHLEVTLLNQMGDHFNPFMYLISPLYWLTSRHEALIILENLFVFGSAFTLFLIAKDKIKSKLMVFAIILGYTLFIGLQNAVIANFHPELMAIFTLSLTLFFMEKEKWKMFFLFLILTLGLKESFPGIGMLLGIYLVVKGIFCHPGGQRPIGSRWDSITHFVRSRMTIKIGIATFLLSLIWYLLAVYVAIPFFAGRPYAYSINQYGVGTSIDQFFNPFIKSKTLVVSFLTFGLLPLGALLFLPVILQDFFIRFVLINSSAKVDLGLHYNAMVAVLLAYGSILGVSILLKNRFYQRIINWHALAIILIVLLFHYKLHGPLGLSYNLEFYKHSGDFSFLNNFLGKIPKKGLPAGRQGLVMTQNNLAVRLTHTNNVMLLRPEYEKWKPDVIALDIRDGQNPNNYWPLSPLEFKNLYEKLLRDKNYKEEKTTSEQIFFLRK